ncbi:MAG: sulfatase-like hydrolase/transferase [Mariniphaga sp.]
MKFSIKSKINYLLLSAMGMNSLSFAAEHSGVNDNPERPNILWITCEDISPYLGSYGFKQAVTPNLDELAEKGIRFTNAYANAPVCAVARSTILSGMYATTMGTHQMRSRIQLPETIPVYPRVLREAGYYCTNNVKKDYNSNYEFDNTIWDESSNQAHYRNRKSGQPFFAVFNNTVTHESQLNEKRIAHYLENNLIPVNPRVNPGDVVLPPYHPDLPEIRQDWARLHDLITLMDKMSGDLLKELEKEGVAENTIVFFYSDHGGQLSRAKRYIYNVGTQVPMIVYLPPKWQHLARQKPGAVNDELVSFVDLAKTILSLTGCNIPEQMQGRIFLGPGYEDAPEYVHFFRDRMSERYDFSRAVTDGRFYYIRNFMPHRPRGRDTRYGYTVQANWRAWEDHYNAGRCNEIQSQFYQPKPVIELFDTQKDPWHVKNLANEPAFQNKVQELSNELDDWMIRTRDVGLIPEPMFHELCGKGKKFETIYEFAQSNDYPVEKILRVAKNASLGSIREMKNYIQYLNDENPIIRFWGAYAVFLTRPSRADVLSALRGITDTDSYAANRIMAAQALAVCGEPDKAFEIIMKEANQTEHVYVLLQALNAFQYSLTDDRLTLADWERFKAKNLLEKDPDVQLGYPNRIITDALELWPERRKVY